MDIRTFRSQLRDVTQQAQARLPELQEDLVSLMVEANERLKRLRSLIAAASRQTQPYVRKARVTTARAGKSAMETAGWAGQASGHAIKKTWAASCTAASMAGKGAVHLGEQIGDLGRQAKPHVVGAQQAVVNWGKDLADKPRQVREARKAKENLVQELLANSLQPLAITDENRRLVAANAKALELLGVSDFNLGNFTIDAFLTRLEVPELQRKDFQAQGEEGRSVRCMVRRLNGTLLVAQCEVVPGVLPHRDLYSFQNVSPYKLAPFVTPGKKKQPEIVELKLDENPHAVAVKATTAPKKIRRHGIRQPV